MNDILGTEIKEGDFIFYGQTSRWPEFMICKVTKELPKTVRVIRVKGDRKSSTYDNKDFIVKDGNHCIVISDENVEKISQMQ